MLTTIAQFRTRVSRERDALITDLQSLTGRFGEEEADAWRRSLPKISDIFQAPSFQPLHLYFGSNGHLSLEYQLPASSSWCDMVLLGAHHAKPSAVIVELKDWQTAADQPGSYEGLVSRRGAQELHPSDQVRGYTEYCRRFHSAIQDHSADVHGCVLFTRDPWTDAYTAEPNAKLASDYPLFTTNEEDVERGFPRFFETRLTEPHEPFATSFELGKYRQRRGFVAQIGKQLLDPQSSPFELLDGQRKAFAECAGLIGDSFHRNRRKVPKKRVVIVRGPPGSGKSVIAARLWATLVTDPKLPEGDVVMVTTSASQNTNWSWLIEKATKDKGSRGVVRKATAFTPIDTQTLGAMRGKRGEGWLGDATKWQANLKTLRSLGVSFRDGSEDNTHLVSIVDEAHALINPEHTAGRGQFGFVVSLGPQAYHIIRSSMLSVFLLDPLQGFRSRENTSIEDIRKWSRDLCGEDPLEVSLEGIQFRCAGSTEYVRWVESLLAGAPASENARIAKTWRNASHSSTRGRSTHETSKGMEIQLFAEPESWEAALRARIAEGQNARLLSSYSREWKTKNASSPHDLELSDKDFDERYAVNGKTKRWSRIWNFVPKNNYAWFVAGHPASYIHEDPLCEVGCPYVVRGFDFDYVGILWLDDLVWRNGRWVVNPDNVHETGHSALTNAARKESKGKRDGPKTAELLERVGQAYRILFTRALKGAYVWVPDRETREHLAASLGA